VAFYSIHGYLFHVVSLSQFSSIIFFSYMCYLLTVLCNTMLQCTTGKIWPQKVQIRQKRVGDLVSCWKRQHVERSLENAASATAAWQR